MAGRSWKIALMRPMAASPRCTSVTAQPSAISGQASIMRYTPNATYSPTLTVPAMTRRPPTASTTTPPSPARSASSGWKAPCALASEMLRSRYSSLSRRNSAVSAASCRYARTIRRPERCSWTCVVMVPNWSWMARVRMWIRWPSEIITTGSPRSGSSASAVSRGLMESMAGSTIVTRTAVSTMYISAGPAAMRAASRSLVERAMRSPVFERS